MGCGLQIYIIGEIIQYIIQRALASKSIDEAQKGAAFAAIIKVILPIIIVIPGITAFVLGADFIVGW